LPKARIAVLGHANYSVSTAEIFGNPAPRFATGHIYISLKEKGIKATGIGIE
jgi:hypothetical protein